LYSGSALNDWTHYLSLEYPPTYPTIICRGNIPSEFGEMVALQVLGLAHNKLTGPLPASLGQLRNLGVFDAAHTTSSMVAFRIPSPI
ncbi:hypothetical protein KI387_031467, partial [Taxus chinensis]